MSNRTHPFIKVKESGLPVVWVIGGPGCGKGTQCDHLRAKYGYVHLAAGKAHP